MAQAPIVLKAADVIAAARRAYEEGRLSAQGPTPECSYRDSSGLPCAIGAALTDEEANGLGGSIGSAVNWGDVVTDDKGRLTTLQTAHDLWANDRRVLLADNSFANEAHRRENDFRALIGLDPLPVEG